MGVLLGLRMGIILAVFQRLGIVLKRREWLKISVRTPMATGPKCFR